MKSVSSNGIEKQPFSESLWYRALTLRERLASRKSSYNDTVSCENDQLMRACARLEQWKHQLAFRDGELFAERLALDAITEQDLLMLLAESIEDLQRYCRDQTKPEWISHLQHLWEANALQDEEAQPPDKLFDAPELLDVLRPLVELGSNLLHQGMETPGGSFQNAPFDAATIHQIFLPNLLPHLQQALLRALILEMHIARLEERLPGDMPQERYRYFLQQYCQPSHFYAFLSEYPMLARSMVTIVQHWADYSLEIVHHLCTDWSEIDRVFAPGTDLGNLVEVLTGAGDTHRRGRSVTILRFRSGFQLVYKPRSLLLDHHFQEVLAWVNTLGIAQPLRTLTILEAGDHGWVEFVQAQECSTQAEISHFYQRQGSYLALLYALDATDFHYENILAAGEHPVLVDLEALFHSRFGEDDPRRESAAAQSVGYSVFRTGLLPSRAHLEEGGEGIDISGLGGQEGQMSPLPLPTWKGRGTDQMRLTRERREISMGKNRPKLLGQEVEITNYTSEILQGFAEMYRLLVRHREEWLTHILPRFEQDEVRVILRPTRTYATLLSERNHPERLRDAIEWERLCDYLWGDVLSRPYLRRVIAAERADLLQGDVPLFTTRPGLRDLFTSRGERIVDFRSVTGMESVKQRSKAMDESDLALQQWIIRASLVTTLMGDKRAPRVPLDPSPPEVTAEQLLQAASSIGKRLDALAIRSEQQASWLGIGAITESESGTIWQLVASSLSLYDGLPGILLFLSYLGKVTGEQQYLNLSNLVLRALEDQIEKERTFHVPQGIGAFSGLGSLVYLYVHLSVLRGEEAFLQRAQEIVEEVEPLIKQDKQFDIIGGSAGCIMCLLGLYRQDPSPRTLEVAILCGEHLLSNAHELAGGLGWYTWTQETELAPSGFSHGAAGIALSLFQLAEASQQERFRQAALAALAYERSLFSSKQGNWARSTRQGEPGFSVTWCHGAPGIGLARLATLHFHDDEEIRQEIRIALETTLAKGFGNNQSLCHGDLGNLETVLTATQILDEPGYREELQRLTAQIFRGIQEHGWVTGVPLGVETPGLMTGLAGIGYELLRLAAPESVPSVLMLAPPFQAGEGVRFQETHLSHVRSNGGTNG